MSSESHVPSLSQHVLSELLLWVRPCASFWGLSVKSEGLSPPRALSPVRTQITCTKNLQGPQMCFNSPFEMVQRLHDQPRAGGGGDDGDEGGRGSVDGNGGDGGGDDGDDGDEGDDRGNVVVMLMVVKVVMVIKMVMVG